MRPWMSSKGLVKSQGSSASTTSDVQFEGTVVGFISG